MDAYKLEHHTFYLMLCFRYDDIFYTWLAARDSAVDSMLRITGGISVLAPENWATILNLLFCQTNLQGFCMNFMLFDFQA
jgi:hypothetical protein